MNSGGCKICYHLKEKKEKQTKKESKKHEHRAVDPWSIRAPGRQRLIHSLDPLAFSHLSCDKNIVLNEPQAVMWLLIRVNSSLMELRRASEPLVHCSLFITVRKKKIDRKKG